jgi:cell division protein FtsB
MESTSSDTISSQLQELQQRNAELEAEVARLSKQVGRVSAFLLFNCALSKLTFGSDSFVGPSQWLSC